MGVSVKCETVAIPRRQLARLMQLYRARKFEQVAHRVAACVELFCHDAECSERRWRRRSRRVQRVLDGVAR